MKRPLLWVCICLTACISLWTYFTDAPPFYEEVPIKEGEHVTVTGQVYKKEYGSYYGTDRVILYLQSIQVIHSDTGRVSDFNPKYKIICELDHTSEKIAELGRQVLMSGVWQDYGHASNPGEFDLADYYAIQNIVGKLEADSVDARGTKFWRVRETLFRLKCAWKDRLYRALPEKEASILAKMLLGDGTGLDKDVKVLYQRSGIIHILSISGLHITMIGMGIYRLLRKCTCPLLPAAVIGMGVLLLYGGMTGFSVSCVRAIGMYLIHMTGILCGRSYDLLTAVGVMLVFMLWGNPRLIYHSGFLLSFGSVSAVGCLYPVLALQGEMSVKNNPLISPFFRIFLGKCQGLLQGIWLSTAISIFTLPITMYFFYEVPVYGAVVNLMVIPFVGPIMVLGFLVSVAPGLFVPKWLVEVILKGYEKVCLFCQELPGHLWIGGRPEGWQMVIYYVGLFGIIWLCREKNNEEEAAHGSLRKRRRPDRRLLLLNIPVLILILGIRMPQETSVSFLDVGQGDGIVAMTESGQVYLFDGGSSTEKKVGQDILLPFLKYHGVGKVDGVFISHPDQDHISGIVELLMQREIQVQKLYLPGVAEECRESFGEVLQAAECPVEYYGAGDCLRTDSFSVTCLHPEKGYCAESNEYSGCFLLEAMDWRVLLTGDVEGEGELRLAEQLGKMRVDTVQVLKISHHGSRYSTTRDFLQNLQADIGVISCGENNLYGHPHEETLARLTEAEIPYYITWKSGCITVTKEGYRTFYPSDCPHP